MSERDVKKQLESFAPALNWTRISDKRGLDVWEAERDGTVIRVEIPYSKNNPMVPVAAMRAEKMMQERENATKKRLDK